MRPKFAFLFVAIPALVALGGCSTDTPPGGDAVACARGGGSGAFRTGDTIPVGLFVKNNGEWCGFGYTFDGGASSSAIISDQPTHGAARVERGTLKDGRLGTKFYYRPDPGFVGTDSFSAMIQNNNWTMKFTVHVRADTPAAPKTATVN
jgi:hypothetical protein